MKYLNRKTARLLIRPLELKDFEAWRRAHAAMATAKNEWDFGPKAISELNRASFKKILSDQSKLRKNDTFYHLAVFDKSGALVGGGSLMEVARRISHTAYLGYRIFNGHWRKGYGKEAVKAMLDIGFTDLKLHRIEAGVEPRNIRSIRLARSLGMRREGLKKKALFLKERWVDIVMYTLTSEDVGRRFDTSVFRHGPRR